MTDSILLCLQYCPVSCKISTEPQALDEFAKHVRKATFAIDSCLLMEKTKWSSGESTELKVQKPFLFFKFLTVTTLT